MLSKHCKAHSGISQLKSSFHVPKTQMNALAKHECEERVLMVADDAVEGMFKSCAISLPGFPDPLPPPRAMRRSSDLSSAGRQMPAEMQ